MGEWCTVQQETQPMFTFWFLVLQRQLIILMFVRSVRAANFPLYIQSLTKHVYCFFTFDHYHYVRRISVRLRDMMTLYRLHPHIYAEFLKGHFTVKKTSRAFSNLAIDQADDQHNAIVKEYGGAFGLTEYPAALQMLISSDPERERVTNDFGR